MAKARARKKRSDRSSEVYPASMEHRDWATVWLALKSFRTFTGSMQYSGLAKAHNQSAQALDALKRLNRYKAAAG